jgi:hypothetical protein
VQSALDQAFAVGVEGLPAYDDCRLVYNQPEDPISMNTVRSGNIVKTIHAEKEIFFCFLDQGHLPVTVDVTTYIEIYENIADREVIETNAIATTCLKDGFLPAGDDDTDDDESEFGSTATVIDCESYNIPTTPVPVGSNCEEIGMKYITHPQEMNTVNKGSIAKTVEAQKEVFECVLETAIKKVEVILFTDIYEDIAAQEVVEVQFHSVRCVVLLSDSIEVADVDDDIEDRRDATVETCQFSTIEN